MNSSLNRAWRALATGCCGGSIWVGGLILACTYFPLLSFLTRDTPTRTVRVRRSLSFWFRMVLRFGQAAGVAKVIVEGKERLDDFAGLIVANHPTLMDVVVIMGNKPTVGCVVKRELWDSPYLRGVVRAADYIPNDSDPEKFIACCAERLKMGGSLLIFPEGTRSHPDRLQHFRRGAANVAVKADCMILPIVILCSPPVMSKGTKWYQVPSQPFVLKLKVGEPIHVSDIVQRCRNRSLSARRLNDFFRHYFEEQLGYGGAGS